MSIYAVEYFILEQVRRSINTENCRSNSCGQHGYCSLDLNGKFSCRCDSGYKGVTCQESEKLNFYFNIFCKTTVN